MLLTYYLKKIQKSKQIWIDQDFCQVIAQCNCQFYRLHLEYHL